MGELNSASAISAALRIAWPARPALPPADSGRMRPTLTWPVPIVAAGAGGGVCAGGARGETAASCWKTLEAPEQPARSAHRSASKPASERRRDSIAGAAPEPAIPRTRRFSSRAALRIGAIGLIAILSYWRRIVNQMKRIMNSRSAMTAQRRRRLELGSMSPGAREFAQCGTAPAWRPKALPGR